MSAIVLGAYFVTTSPGGYTLSFLLFFVLLEPWRRPGPIVAVICAYLLCLVADWSLATVLEVPGASWLSGQPVIASFGLALGHFVRPGLIILLVWALALDSLMLVARAHGAHRPSLGLQPA
jgi:hypothetical protein